MHSTRLPPAGSAAASPARAALEPYFYLERRAGHHVHPPIITLECGSFTLFSFFYSEVRTRGNDRVKVAAYLTQPQCTAGTCNKCLSEKELTRKQARTHSVNLCPFVLVHKTQTKCFCHPL
eukprot:scaffold2830_cov123-Isochrysis_galbana.AAC.15